MLKNYPIPNLTNSPIQPIYPMQTNIQFLENFPPQNGTQKSELLQYIHRASIAAHHWQIIKGVYKKAEQTMDVDILVALIAKLDKAKFADLKSKYPKAATLGYMKRRARRFLRNLSSTNEVLYLQICSRLLNEQNHTLDFDNQWVIADIIAGYSKRYKQLRNGRGKIAKIENVPNIYRREERAANLWDKHPNILYPIFQNSNDLTAEVYEFALKVLLRNQSDIPVFTKKQKALFLKSDAVWLIQQAADQSYKGFEIGELKDAELLAYTYFYSPANRRAALLKSFAQLFAPETPIKAPLFQRLLQQLTNLVKTDSPVSNTWKRTFVEALSRLLFEQITKGNTSKRVDDATDLVLQLEADVPSHLVREYATTLLGTGKKAIVKLVIETAKKAKIKEIIQWLELFTIDQKDDVAQLEEIFFEKIMGKPNSDALLERKTLGKQSLLTTYVYHNSLIVSNFGWRLVANYKKSKDFTRTFWSHNYYWGWRREAFIHAVQSDYGAQMLVTHCTDRFRWVSYRTDTVIKIIEFGALVIKKAFTKLLIKNASPGTHSFFYWLPHIAKLEVERDMLVETIRKRLNLKSIDKGSLADVLVSHNNWVSDIAWDIFLHHAIHKKTVNYLVKNIFEHRSHEVSEAFTNKIMATKNATLKQLFFDGVQELLNSGVGIFEKISGIFGQLASQLEPAVILEIIRNSSDTNWQQIRPHIITYAQSEKGSQFWKLVTEQISEAGDETLLNRILQDEQMLTQFYALEDSSVLDIQHPMFTDILQKWISRHEAMFSPNSPELFRACIHKMQPVRNWGLDRAKTDMEMPFALQLMESGMTDPFEVGKQFFENVEARSEDEFEYILALCDSPQVAVRVFGLAYFEARKAHLKTNPALACLSEHSDPNIQKFVAEVLAEQAAAIVEPAPYIKTFDKTLLRTKNRSRKAKEMVKNRLENNLKVNPETLLEVARGQNQTDREWAILQLTKLALSGEEIEGFSLS